MGLVPVPTSLPLASPLVMPVMPAPLPMKVSGVDGPNRAKHRSEPSAAWY